MALVHFVCAFPNCDEQASAEPTGQELDLLAEAQAEWEAAGGADADGRVARCSLSLLPPPLSLSLHLTSTCIVSCFTRSSVVS